MQQLTLDAPFDRMLNGEGPREPALRRHSLRELFDEIVRGHRSSLPKIVAPLRFSGRMTSSCGTCYTWTNKDTGCYRVEIVIAKWHVEQSPWDQVVDTLLHEIAHAMTPGDGHGRKWRAACRLLGAKPERMAPEGVANKATQTKKWRCECRRCGKVWNKGRRKRRFYGRVHCCDDGRHGQIIYLDRRSGQISYGVNPDRD